MSIVPINEGEGRNLWWDSSAMHLWDPFMDFFPDMGFGSSVNTRVDWRESSRAHVWKVVLPGFANEDGLVELQDDRVLQVSVESGNFMTRFKIPEDGNLQDLKANMHHGVLLVTVPKFTQQPPNTNIRLVQID
ncbi:hypothetical protein RJT34_30087 [Clitoria ternatea]|uniref:SHSP domain-containing protein n=1 Tax=Clitoria ternatea TaxID=43366 RepID=A0AAN9ESN8_CLITE